MKVNPCRKPWTVVAAMACLIALAGCQPRPAKPTTTPGATAASASAAAGQPPAPVSASTRGGGHARHAEPALPSRTGIAVCDDYLSSYLACHRAAHIYSPEQLQSRYQEMRTTLLRESLDPNVRPELAGRCNALAIQMRQALHGQPCDGPSPGASAAGSP